jgi:tetratricopeptide (TPR) repeat protein
VTDGLNIILTSEEKRRLADHGTENAEAYELYLKARDYIDRNTKEGYELALMLQSEAVRLDPNFAEAYISKANSLAALYRLYTRDAALLEEGLQLIREAQLRRPDVWDGYGPLSVILLLQGKKEEAEQAAKEYVAKSPENPASHFALGFFYLETVQPVKAIAALEQVLQRRPEDLSALHNLCMVCEGEDDTKLKHWAHAGLPLLSRRVKLFPDDENLQVMYAYFLFYAGEIEKAKAGATELSKVRDARSIYNIACLWRRLEEPESAFMMFLRSLDAGFRWSGMRRFIENDWSADVKASTVYQEALNRVEQIEAKAMPHA